MLSQDAVLLADRLFGADKRHRERHLKSQIQSLISEAAGRGQLGAGRLHASMVDLYVQEFRARCELLWDVLQRVLSAEGVVPSATLSSSIKAFLVPRVARECNELSNEAGELMTRFRSSGMQTRIADELQPIEESLFARVDLFAKELRSTTSTRPTSGVVQNFYESTVGVVQTGPYATATVHQSVVLGDTSSTLSALEALSMALAGVTQAAGYSQRELIGLVTDLSEEVRKPQPNRLKVGQMAAGLGLALQSVASVKPAYELVRTAFLSWGIHLPILS